MDQLMLLAQLCGDGKQTEAALRSHGLDDLGSIARTDSRKLSETLGISDTAAKRMVRQAQELLESALTKEPEPKPKPKRKPKPVASQSGPPRKGTIHPAETEATVPGQSARDESVTAAEIDQLRGARLGEKGVVLVEADPSTAALTKDPKPSGKETNGFAVSFWYFG